MRLLIPLLLFIGCSLSSCVTLFSSRTVKVPVKAPPGTTLVWNNNGHTDTVVASKYKSYLPVLRSGNRLYITAINDSIHTDLSVRPTVNGMIFANMYFFGIPGFVVDMCSPKRFTYPRTFIELRSAPQATRFVTVRRRSYHTGSTELTCTTPLAHFWQHDIDGFSPRLTVTGLGLGGTYYYAPDAFVFVEGAVSFSKMGRDYWRYDWENGPSTSVQEILGWSAAARHHHRLGRFDIGYGLGFTQYIARRYHYLYGNGSVYAEVTERQRNFASIGSSISAGFRITNDFFARFTYQPQLIAIEQGVTFDYRHTYNFGFNWQIRLSSQ